jgi:hypothetical protein
VTIESGKSKPVEYRSTTPVAVLLIIGAIFAVVGIVSVCVGWSVYLDRLGDFPDRGPRFGGAFALTIGMGLSLPFGLFCMLCCCLPPSFTRIDATGVQVRNPKRLRSFAWHELADIYVQERRDRHWNKDYFMKGRLHSGKTFFLPGLTNTDFDVAELRQIREDLVQRLRND